MFGKRSLLGGSCHMQGNQSAVNDELLPGTELFGLRLAHTLERGVQTTY